jgi:hypothetical protein
MRRIALLRAGRGKRHNLPAACRGRADGDSGWYVAPAERPKPRADESAAGSEPPPSTRAVSDFSRSAPTCGMRCRSRKGYLVVLPAKSRAVLDPQDRKRLELKEMTTTRREGRRGGRG